MAERPIAVITGASSGIGEALARRLARDGWLTVLLARRRDRIEALAAELGGEAEVCDVSDRLAVEQVAGKVLARHPRVKLLVNNAGISGRGDFITADVDRIEQVIRTNYLGGVWCLRAFMPGARGRGPGRRRQRRLGLGNGRVRPRRAVLRVEARADRVLARPPPPSSARAASASTRSTPASFRQRASRTRRS